MDVTDNRPATKQQKNNCSFLLIFSPALTLYMIDAIDHSYDGRVDRTIFISLRHAGRRPADNDDPLVKARADRVNGNKIAALVRAVEIDRLDYEQLFSLKPFVFLRGHDRAQNSGNYHLSGQQSAISDQHQTRLTADG
jgi:hypothetical protein